jgi:hypothetical protein
MYENDPLTEAIIGAALRVRTEVGEDFWNQPTTPFYCTSWASWNSMSFLRKAFQ